MALVMSELNILIPRNKHNNAQASIVSCMREEAELPMNVFHRLMSTTVP